MNHIDREIERDFSVPNDAIPSTLENPTFEVKTSVQGKVESITTSPITFEVELTAPFSIKSIFTGQGSLYETETEWKNAIENQIKTFIEVGFMAIYSKSGLNTTGFSIATGEFLANFKKLNQWTPGFVQGAGRPKDGPAYNFGDKDGYQIGEVSISDKSGFKKRTPIYVIGKTGEGVLTQKNIQAFKDLFLQK